ncbi:MAG: hypothetical protein WKF96_17600 [Solirubrobacteraceae bacterium]
MRRNTQATEKVCVLQDFSQDCNLWQSENSIFHDTVEAVQIPELIIGGRSVPAARLTVSPHEAACLLEKGLQQVSALMVSGELTDFATDNRPHHTPKIEVVELASVIERQGGSPLALFALGELVAGRLHIPTQTSSEARTPTLAALLYGPAATVRAPVAGPHTDTSFETKAWNERP